MKPVRPGGRMNMCMREEKEAELTLQLHSGAHGRGEVMNSDKRDGRVNFREISGRV